MAKNGAAFVIVAPWANYPQQCQGPMDMEMTHMQAFDMTDPAVHNYVSQMCEEVHFYGSKILISQNLVYPEGYTLNGGFAFGPGPRKETAPIPAEMIPQMIQDYVAMLRRYRNLGYYGLTDIFYPIGDCNGAGNLEVCNREAYSRAMIL
ncbi:MAG: hypothetical protein PUC06_04565 [Oscillospiraceae bacterium]|nr:hypothetical protein [Oscillospiraceae bacterium]